MNPEQCGQHESRLDAAEKEIDCLRPKLYQLSNEVHIRSARLWLALFGPLLALLVALVPGVIGYGRLQGEVIAARLTANGVADDLRLRSEKDQQFREHVLQVLARIEEQLKQKRSEP